MSVPPPRPRPSSTVILLRQGEGDVEVFMVRRSPRSEFAASVYVFPGGSVCADDQSPQVERVCAGLSPEIAHGMFVTRGGNPPSAPRQSLGLIVAALRELYEEAGVLLASESDGHPMDLRRDGRLERLAAARPDVEEGRLSLAALAAREEIQLAWRELVYFSHWITPIGFSRRFDTRFFLAPLPEGQAALYGPRETTAGCWISPRQALAKAAQGRFPLVFATTQQLRRLCGPETVDDLLRFGREKPIRTVQPTMRDAPDGPEAHLPADGLPW